MTTKPAMQKILKGNLTSRKINNNQYRKEYISKE
jgi:hypothetical protein